MKKLSFLFFIIFVFLSCNKEDNKPLTAFDAEVFTISMDNLGWEATFKVKLEGFIQEEVNNTYAVDIEMNIDLITPSNQELKNFASQNLTESFSEKQYPHLILESSQLISPELGTGTYKAVFTIKDKKKNSVTKITKEFLVQ